MNFAWMKRDIYEALSREADRAYPNETGGILVGYRADNEDIVIYEAIGPGPNAMHAPTRFIPDHKWQCDHLDHLYSESQGSLVYIGDWHTHPNGVPELSWLDKRTLCGIAKHHQANASSPVMMIGAGEPGNWDWKIHELGTRRLFGLLATTTVLETKYFD